MHPRTEADTQNQKAPCGGGFGLIIYARVAFLYERVAEMEVDIREKS